MTFLVDGHDKRSGDAFQSKMVAIALGFWWDHSRPSVLASTLTLSVDWGYLLLSALTFLVTVAGAHCWGIVSFILHHRKAKQSTGALDLQHRVALRSSGSAANTLWEVIQIHMAWAGKRPRNLTWRMLSIALPALAVTAGFAVAALFTSRVATNKAYGAVVARAVPQDCGHRNLMYTMTTDEMTLFQAMERSQVVRSRQYADSFYANESTASVGTPFVQATLPYDTDASAPCPIPAANRCRLGPNKAFSVTSAALDSHDMLGINARFDDRIAVQFRTTCSPIDVDDLLRLRRDKQGIPTHAEYHLGWMASYDSGNLTFLYKLALATDSGVGYTFQAFQAVAYSPDVNLWTPIEDFARDDADITLVLLSANDIRYASPNHDPWFSANGTFNFTFTLPGSLGGAERTLFSCDHVVSALICADQYRFCNPSTNMQCGEYGGIWEFISATRTSQRSLGFSFAQAQTAMRIASALNRIDTNNIVFTLGASNALRAARPLSGVISPGLPDNQWQIEVEGWFQTMLARLQAGVVEFSVKEGTSPFETLQREKNRSLAVLPEMLKGQCPIQLVRTAGEVQNFSVLGVFLVLAVSVVLIIVNLTLEWIVDFVGSKREGRPMPRAAWARQADSKYHLLRLALTGSRNYDGSARKWMLGRWGVPVPAGEADGCEIETFTHGEDRLASYVVESVRDPFQEVEDTKHEEGCGQSVPENGGQGGWESKTMTSGQWT
ncbi:hypothetical protein VTJ49DRAFT_2275 [Mycothermus thermophilus]|uniref:Uncharacterized protein n=1 Tax=Humicola insolens TaxID=85995 RepID=A0ABR3VA50_HUMIN